MVRIGFARVLVAASWMACTSGSIPGGSESGQEDAATGESDLDASASADAAGGTSDRPGTADARPGPDRPRRDAATAPDGFFGEARCADDLLFCEDFEAGALNPAKWVLNYPVRGESVKDATAKIESGLTARGKRALHVKLTSAAECAQIFATAVPSFPMAGKQLFVRAFVHVDKLTPNRHWALFIATDTVVGKDEYYARSYRMRLLPQDEKLPGVPNVFFWNYTQNAGGYFNKATVTKAPLGTWDCWQWELDFRGGAKTVRFYLNDQEVRDAIWAGEAPLEKGILSFGISNGHV